MKLAAVILVSVGTVGLLFAFTLMRRNVDALRRFKEGGE